MRARIEKVNVLGWSKSYEFWEIWVIILLDFLLVTGGTKMWNLNEQTSNKKCLMRLD